VVQSFVKKDKRGEGVWYQVEMYMNAGLKASLGCTVGGATLRKRAAVCPNVVIAQAITGQMTRNASFVLFCSYCMHSN
jgi:hypothetical protein